MCGNGVEVAMEAMDDAVLASISDIFTPDLERELVARLLRRSDEQAAADPRAPLDAELGTVERQLANLTDALALGGTTGLPSLVERLRTLEQRRQELVDTLGTMPARVTRLRPDRRALEREIRRVLAEWRELLHEDVPGARRVLRELPDGPLRLTPIDEPTRRGYRFDGAVTFGDPLTGLVLCPCGGVPGQNRRR